MPAPRVKGPERERRLAAALAVVSGLLCALVASPAVAAPADGGPIAPWKAAEQVRASLFDAQTALLLDQAPEASVGVAREAFERGLERELERTDPRAAADARAALARAATALAGGDETGLAAARGSLVAALRRGAYAVTLEAVEASDVATARRWILVRDFRQATRYTRPGVDATAALDALEAGEIAPGAAALQVRKDLLDAYQARLGDYLAEAEREAERGFGPALAESAALVRGYWLILAEEYLEQRGGPAEREADRAFVDLVDAAGDADPGRFAAATQAVEKRLDGFTAAPFTPEEQARRAAQLTRFVDLIPVEYDHGTEDGRVTIPFELQEMLAFIDAADSALTDLEGELDERDPQAAASVERDLERLRTIANDANEGRSVAALEQVEALEGEVSGTLDAVFPEEWKQSTDEADYDLVDISLDQMEAAISAGEYEQAEQARLSAYALFEFGPEIKLKAFDPQLVAEIEGMVWYGARGVDGLAEMIAAGADLRQIRETRLELDEALDEARAKTGDGASDATVITNAATIVFREGLEAILIVAAVTASMVGANRRLRRPGLSRRPAGAARERAAVHRLAARARLALAVRRAARGDRRRGRDRGPDAGHELVLSPRLLDRVDIQPPQAGIAALRRDRGRGRRRSGDGRRPLPARLLERPPRGLRDGPLPAGAAAQLRDRDRRRRGRVRPARDGQRSESRPSCSSAGFPTSGC